MNAVSVAGYVGSFLVFVAFGMKNIIPLRLVAICSNVAFLIYGLGTGLAPVWILHAALLPMNLGRLWEQLRPFWAGRVGPSRPLNASPSQRPRNPGVRFSANAAMPSA